MTKELEHRQADFDALYLATSHRLTRQIYALTNDAAEAQDCVQEAFEKAWARWNQIQGHPDPEAWVRTVARRLAISRWRRARAGLLQHRKLGQPHLVDAPSEDHIALMEAFCKISLKHREVIVLHHLCELTVAQVAQQLQIPEATVKARLQRGRRALAPLLAEQMECSRQE